ncbi:hypothetical protein ACFL01_00840 [Planctomycetota bacterium]
MKRRNASLSARGILWMRSVAAELQTTWKWLCEEAELRNTNTLAWIALLTAIGATVRYCFLTQPMRYDEAFTFLNFVNRSVLHLFNYPSSNNHVLHTILVRMSVTVFGSHPATIRLPAFCAGVCVIPLTFCLARLLTRNDRGGFLAGGLAAVFPYLILYDTMARGYSLIVLLSLCLAILTFRLITHPSTRLCVPVSLLTALGLLTMPTFLFPAAGLLSWALVMLLHRGHKPVWVLTHILMPCTILTTSVTGLFYTPTIILSDGIRSIVANDSVRSRPWSEFLSAIPKHFTQTADCFARDIPAALVIGALLLLAAGLYALARKGRWDACSLLPALVIGGAAVFLAKRAIPFERTWIYILPFLFALADAGWVSIVKSTNLLVRSVLVLLTGGAAALLMYNNVIPSYPDTGHFPEASAVVNVLSDEMDPGDKVAARCPADAPVFFYMWYRNVPYHKGGTDRAAAPKMFFVVKKSWYPLTDMTAQNARKILDIGDAELYVLDRKD